MKSRILASLAVLCALSSFILLGLRNDSELISPDEYTQSVEWNVEPSSSITLLSCLQDDSASSNAQSALTLRMGNTAQTIELSEPRPLTLPRDFADQHAFKDRQFCNVADNIQLPDDLQGPIIVDSNPGSLIIAGVNSPESSIPYKLLFLAFLCSVWGAFAAASQKYQLRFSQLGRIDGIAGFFLAMLAAFLVDIVLFKLIPNSATLFPGYSEMLATMAVNFVCFPLIAVAFVAFRKKFPAHTPTAFCLDIDDASDNPNTQINSSSDDDAASNIASKNLLHPYAGNQSTPFNPTISLGAGFILAVVAILSTLFAPIPGLSIAEMSAFHTSTLYITAIFAVLAGFSEECLFRGLIQSSLEARPGTTHPWRQNIIAILVSSALFVLIHVAQSLDHLWALIPIALVSLTSGFLKVRYHSLFPCILLHMTYNALLLLPSLAVL